MPGLLAIGLLFCACAPTSPGEPDARGDVDAAPGPDGAAGDAEVDGPVVGGDGGRPPPASACGGPAGAPVLLFHNFDGLKLPTNGAGATYPDHYDGEGGVATVHLDRSPAVCGSSVRFELTAGTLYGQFNAHRMVGRGFAREFGLNPGAWQFNTYDRMSFWLFSPTNGHPLGAGGVGNIDIGTYVKRVDAADPGSDEAGGGHFYHAINVAPTGTWTRVIIDMHPTHERGANGNTDQNVRAHPTGENAYNYFDALTRFYVNAAGPPGKHPASYRIDEIHFYRERHQENVNQVYSLAATYVPGKERLVVSWNRRKDEMAPHEVVYAFDDVHVIGWDAAIRAPGSPIAPPGDGGYNLMVYDTLAIPLAGRDRIYVAIRPVGATLFSQIELPLLR